MTYWFFPLPRLIFMIAPLLHIFFDVKLFVSTVEESIAYAATYIVVNAMMHNHLYGHVRWPWMSELYEYVQGVYLIKAIASVIASPRKPTFNVTAKGISLDSDHLSPLAWPFLIAFVVLLAGVVTAGWRYAFEPGVNGVMLVVGLWALFNLIIAAAALGVVAERRELRKHPRLAVQRRGRVSFDDYTADVAIENVSAGGCAIRVPGAAFFGSLLLVGQSRGRLTIDSVGGRGECRTLEATIVRAESCENSAVGRPEIRNPHRRRLSRARRPHVRRRRCAGEIPHRAAPAQGDRARHPGVPALEHHRAVPGLLLPVSPAGGPKTTGDDELGRTGSRRAPSPATAQSADSRSRRGSRASHGSLRPRSCRMAAGARGSAEKPRRAVSWFRVRRSGAVSGEVTGVRRIARAGVAF